MFFHSWLRSKLGARLYHQNRQLGGAPLLLVNLSQRPLEPGLWLTAWLCVSAACPSEVFDWPLPANELLLAIEHMQPRALLLYASDSLPSPLLQQQLPRLLASSPVPLLLAGPASQIHAASLQDLPGLHLAAGPLAALHSLQHLELLGSAQGSPA